MLLWLTGEGVATAPDQSTHDLSSILTDITAALFIQNKIVIIAAI